MFYQIKRDGYARVGYIEIDGEKHKTPLMVDDEIKDRLKVKYGLAPYVANFELPENEIVVATGLQTLLPRELVNAFKNLRGRKPLYVVSAATPANVSLLIYLGSDLLDDILAVAKAYNGYYFLGDLEIEIQKLDNFPCGCCFCRRQSLKDLSEEEIFEIVSKHNSEQIRLEIEKCRYLIEREELRNYVEAKAKLYPEMTATLRISDFDDEKDPFPRFKKSTCYFSSQESFNRFEVQYFLSRSLECYKPKTKTLLLLPCSAKKPYLLSKTHRTIRSAVNIKVNEIIISSPLVVPREFELIYPAVNYDTPTTGHWSEEEISFVASQLANLVEKGNFEKIVAHVEWGYRKVVEKALKDYNVVFTSKGDILSRESLKALKKELENESDYDLYGEMFLSAFRYQFGVEIGGKVRGRYPEIELWKDERVARFDLKYGMLDIYKEAAELLLKEEKYVVKIEDFEPKGTIFAAGIIEADENIKPNDIVVFENSTLFGVGIARIHGKEMVKNKGVAVEVKRTYSKNL